MFRVIKSLNVNNPPPPKKQNQKTTPPPPPKNQLQSSRSPSKIRNQNGCSRLLNAAAQTNTSRFPSHFKQQPSLLLNYTTEITKEIPEPTISCKKKCF